MVATELSSLVPCFRYGGSGPANLSHVAKHASWTRRAEDREFAQMQRAFGPHGGLLGGNDVARAMRHRTSQPLSELARSIVAREVVHVEHRSCILLPMFQFHPTDFTVRRTVIDVVRELRDALDDWEIALWFEQPKAWLGGSAPVDCPSGDEMHLVRAARADRVISLG